MIIKQPTHEHFAVLVGDATNTDKYVSFHSQTEADIFISEQNEVFHSQFTELDYEQGDAPEYVYMTRYDFKEDYESLYEWYLEGESIELAVELTEKLEEITINVTKLRIAVVTLKHKGVLKVIDSENESHVCELRGTKYRTFYELVVALDLDITDFIE